MPDFRGYLLRSMALAERVRIGRTRRSHFLYRFTLNIANRSFQPVRTRFDWLSRDAAEVDRFSADPFCGWVGTAQLWVDLTSLALEAWRPGNQRCIPRDLPICLFAGTMDPVSDGCKQLIKLAGIYRRIGIRDVREMYYPGGRHEMLNEINRDEVTSDLAAWLEGVRKRTAAL